MNPLEELFAPYPTLLEAFLDLPDFEQRELLAEIRSTLASNAESEESSMKAVDGFHSMV